MGGIYTPNFPCISTCSPNTQRRSRNTGRQKQEQSLYTPGIWAPDSLVQNVPLLLSPTHDHFCPLVVPPPGRIARLADSIARLGNARTEQEEDWVRLVGRRSFLIKGGKGGGKHREKGGEAKWRIVKDTLGSGMLCCMDSGK